MAIAEFALDGAKIMVEVDEPEADGKVVRVARTQDGWLKASEAFEASLASIKRVAEKVLGTIKELEPDEGEVTLGFKLTAEAGAIITKLGGEANIELKLVWKRAAPVGPGNGTG